MIFLADSALQEALTPSEGLTRALGALTIFLVVALVGRVFAAITGRIFSARGSRQAAMVARRLVFYLGLLVGLAASLRYAGVDPGVLLGTAGIVTVAFGFASQTSASNLISGIFLLFERTFVVGDIIRVNDRQGEVLSVDMLSVKIRTFDNLFVRIPNETLLKAEIANISHFPIRRVDVMLSVAYGEDMASFREALFQLAAENQYVLDEPTPMVLVDSFKESTVVVQFSTWAERDRFLDAKNTLLESIQERIYGGSFRSPYPVRVMVPHKDKKAGLGPTKERAESAAPTPATTSNEP